MNTNKKQPLGTAPLSYFWAIEYVNGTTISQFNPNTGKEVQWSNVFARNKDIKTAFWLPFSPQFALKVFQKNKLLCSCIHGSLMMRVDLPPKADLILRKRTSIKMSGIAKSVYMLGFELDGHIHVIGKDSTGVDLLASQVASWAQSATKMNTKGMLEER